MKSIGALSRCWFHSLFPILTFSYWVALLIMRKRSTIINSQYFNSVNGTTRVSFWPCWIVYVIFNYQYTFILSRTHGVTKLSKIVFPLEFFIYLFVDFFKDFYLLLSSTFLFFIGNAPSLFWRGIFVLPFLLTSSQRGL